MKERLMEFIKSQGLTVSRFQRRIGVSDSYIRNISRGIGTDVLLAIEREFPQLNTHWLLTGEGGMLAQSLQEGMMPRGKMIPVLPVSAQAGRLNDFMAQVSDYDCERIFTPIPDAEMVIPITGDSMTPEYVNGSRVLVKRIDDRAFIDWGKTYVLDTDSGVVIKNIFPTSDPAIVRCMSVNPAYPPFEVQAKDIYAWYKVLMSMTMK
jgi:phage repressor protein C with HTH and peptisase S24 domain